jgi:hypothetical protein
MPVKKQIIILTFGLVLLSTYISAADLQLGRFRSDQPIELQVSQMYEYYIKNSKELANALVPMPDGFSDKVDGYFSRSQVGDGVCGWCTILHMELIKKYFEENKVITSDAFKDAALLFMQNTLFNGTLTNGMQVSDIPLIEVEEFLPKLQLSPEDDCSEELFFAKWVQRASLNNVYCTYVDGIGENQAVGYIRPQDSLCASFEERLHCAQKCKEDVATELMRLNDINAHGRVFFAFLRLASTHWLVLWVEKHPSYPPTIGMVDSLGHADLANRPDVQFFINHLYAMLQPGHVAFKNRLAQWLHDEQLAKRANEEEFEFYTEEQQRIAEDTKLAHQIEDELLAQDVEQGWHDQDQQQMHLQLIQDEAFSQLLFNRYQEENRQQRQLANAPQVAYDKGLSEFIQSTNWDTNHLSGWAAWQAYRWATWRK